MAKKKSFLESRGFKNLMKYLYGIGAAVVIGGALFKIMHWPGANMMLIAGMSTEVLIFFVSAFEPLHEELDWTRVYPELADSGFLPEDDLLPDTNNGMTPEEAFANANAGMKEIEITPDLFESLSSSLNGLKSNVSKLSEIQDATVATNEYTQNVRTASSKMGELNESYASTANAMGTLANSVGGAAQNAQAYHEQVAKATQNLSSLNAVYEMELADAQAHIKSLNKFYEAISGAMENMTEASKGAEEYRASMSDLTGKLKNLNRIYGGMLSAMSGGQQG
jgi:gliding motility-associated protein GldL